MYPNIATFNNSPEHYLYIGIIDIRDDDVYHLNEQIEHYFLAKYYNQCAECTSIGFLDVIYRESRRFYPPNNLYPKRVYSSGYFTYNLLEIYNRKKLTILKRLND